MTSETSRLDLQLTLTFARSFVLIERNLLDNLGGYDASGGMIAPFAVTAIPPEVSGLYRGLVVFAYFA